MKTGSKDLMRRNRAAIRRSTAPLGSQAIRALNDLTRHFGFSIALGDLLLLDGKWYITHAGLIRLAQRCQCAGIHVHPVRTYCNSAHSQWVFRATVYKSSGSKGFV